MLLRTSVLGLVFAYSTLVACSGTEHQIGDQSGAGSGGRAGSPGSGGTSPDDKGGTGSGGTGSGGTGSGGTGSGGTGSGGTSTGGAVGTGGASGAVGSGGSSGSAGHAGSTGGSDGEDLTDLARDCTESGGKLVPVNETYPPGTPYCPLALQANCPPREVCIARQACECPIDQCFAIYGINGAVFGKCQPK